MGDPDLVVATVAVKEVNPELIAAHARGIPVVIRAEMVHEQRIIPTDGRAHTGKNIKTYMGNSVGHLARWP